MKVIVILVVVLVVLGAIVYFLPNEGQREFKKQVDALQSVQSWKMDLQVSANSRLIAHRTHDAQCPDMEHITETGPESMGEFIRMSNLVYYRKNGAGWIQDTHTPQDLFMPLVTPRPCMSNPGGTTTSADSGDVEWRTELNRAIKEGTFRKGDMDTVNGATCRDWQVSWTNLRNQLVAYTMCVNEQDHLPRRIQMLRENVNMYFQWNVPVEVVAPESSSVPEAPPTSDGASPDATPAQPRSVPLIPGSRGISPT